MGATDLTIYDNRVGAYNPTNLNSKSKVETRIDHTLSKVLTGRPDSQRVSPEVLDRAFENIPLW